MLRAVLLLVISTSLISCSGDFQQFRRSFGQLIVFTKSHTAQAERRVPEGNKKYLAQIQASTLPPVRKVKEPIVVSPKNKNTVATVNKNKQGIGEKFKNLFKRSKTNQNATIEAKKDIQNLGKTSSSSQMQQPRPIKCLPAAAYKEKDTNKKILNKNTKPTAIETKGKVNNEFPKVQSIPPKPVVFKNPKDMQTKISNDIKTIKQEVKEKFPAKKGVKKDAVNNKKSNNKSSTSKISAGSTVKSQNKKENSKPTILPMPSQSTKSTTPNSSGSINTKKNVASPVVPPSGNNAPPSNNKDKAFTPVAPVPTTSNTIDKGDSKSKSQDSPALPVLLPPPLPSNVVDAIKNGNKSSDDPFLPASRYNK
ncbi:hypothetical protein NOVO_00255 [Rickettsiales bacterium Ac37b]|nr:hypothetical protein NOVO_00255 [Rickettsiales bacterium Ac37b]